LEEVQETVDALVRSWVLGSNCLGFVVALSGARSEYHRTRSYPEYKANRSANVPPRWLVTIREYLRTLPTVSHVEFEADDLMAKLAHTGCTLVSIDKDLLQIPGKHYNPDKDEHHVVSDDDSDYNHHLQWIMGDATDNYPGIRGVGPAKAGRILEGVGREDRTDAVYRAYYDRDYPAQFAVTMYVCATLLWKPLVIPTPKDPELLRWFTLETTTKSQMGLLDESKTTPV